MLNPEIIINSVHSLLSAWKHLDNHTPENINYISHINLAH